MRCDDRFEWQDDQSTDKVCPSCEATGSLRPNIVWFGEIPYFLDEIDVAMKKATIFAAIGTSGLVYPAAGLVDIAKSVGARTIEFNLNATEHQIGSMKSDQARRRS